MSKDAAEPRKLSRHETHDLGMIIKERAKVLKAHVTHQSAACLADFEQQIAAEYAFDDDEVWKAATEEAMKVVKEAQKKIDERCTQMGIPKTFAPGLGISWHSRGENAAKDRRTELRRVAKTRIDAMAREAEMRVEREALDLRTQVVAMGLLSPAASEFLTTMKTVEQAMPSLDFKAVDKQLADETFQKQRRLGQFH